MHNTSLSLFIACSLIGLCVNADAKTDPECLKHLGGGYSDTECFSGLRTQFVADNDKLYKKIRSRIPRGNPHATTLDAYMTAQNDAVKYCTLQRDAGAGWQENPNGTMHPALYEQCVYELRKSQNKFLNDLYAMAKDQ